MKEFIENLFRTLNPSVIYTIISIGLALAAIISPICVALINNNQQKKQRQVEFSHEEVMRKIEIKHEIAEKRIEHMISLKQEAFSNFLEKAGIFYIKRDNTFKSELQFSAYKAASLCSTKKCRDLLFELINVISDIYAKKDFDRFHFLLKDITEALQADITVDFITDET